MASSTTNLDLTLPVGGENVSRQIINANNVKIDEAVGAVPSGTDLQSQVTALNNKLTYDMGSMTVSAFQSALETLCGSMANGGIQSLKVTITTSSGKFDNTGYVGVVSRVSSDRYNVMLGRNNSLVTLRGAYTSYGWTWEELALKSEMKVPDWSNPTTNLCTVSNVGWTATGYGFIKVSAQWDRGGQLNINGVTIYYVDRSYYGGINFHVEWLVPVKTGDIVKIIADNGTLPSGMNAEFYPLR